MSDDTRRDEALAGLREHYLTLPPDAPSGWGEVSATWKADLRKGRMHGPIGSSDGIWRVIGDEAAKA